MLWRPHLDRGAVRTRAIRESLWPTHTLEGLTGLLFIVVALLNAPAVAWPVLAVGTALVALAAIWARVDYLCWGHDLGPRWAAFRVDRGHGDLYLRQSDLNGLPWHIVEAGTRVIEVVRALHGPVAAWIDPDLLDAIHDAAWDRLTGDLQDSTSNIVTLAAAWTGIAEDARHLNWILGRDRPHETVERLPGDTEPPQATAVDSAVTASGLAVLTGAVSERLAVAAHSLDAERFSAASTDRRCA